MINRLIVSANEWVGYSEKFSPFRLEHKTKNAGNKDYTIFARDYDNIFRKPFKAQGKPWCAVFIVMMFVYSFGKKEAKRFIRCSATVKNMYRWFKRKKRLVNIPRIGDIVFMTSNGERINHCGIVVDITTSGIVTIEGNAKNPNGSDIHIVVKKERPFNDEKIISYGRWYK